MDDDVKELLGRAKAPARKSTRRPAPPPAPEKRYVFGGGPAGGRTGSPAAPRLNTRAARRSVSTFYTIIMLFGGGILIVLYVHNIITINRLAAEVGMLRTRLEQVQNTNAALEAEVNRKAARERIGKAATEQLGLTFPTEQALEVSVDQEALARARDQAGDEGAGTRGRDGGSGTQQSSH